MTATTSTNESSTVQRRRWGPPIRLARRSAPKHAVHWRLAGVVVALVAALASVPLFAQGIPGQSLYSQIWTGTFGSAYGLESVAILAAPLILTSLAASIPYRMGLWNIGGDGQMYMGAWLATAIGFALPHLGAGLLIPLMLLGAMVGGALWILIPALARAYLGVNEIITTLMLNYVGLYWLTYFATGPWADSNVAAGVLARPIPAQSQLSHVNIGQFSVHWGFYLAIAVGAALTALFRYTRLGFELGIVRASPPTADYVGMSTRRRTIQVLIIGGGLGGLAGGVELMGNLHQYSPAISNNTGYMGIAVALIAGASELGVVGVAILFAGVLAASTVLTVTNVSAGVAVAILGVVLLASALGEIMSRYKLETRRVKVASAEPPAARRAEPDATSVESIGS